MLTDNMGLLFAVLPAWAVILIVLARWMWSCRPQGRFY